MRSFAEGLQATGGEIGGWVFENPLTGLPRNVYMSVRVDFAELRLAEELLEPGLLADWLTLPARDWRALDGHVWTGDFPTDADWERRERGGAAEFVEASFYMVEHDMVRSSGIALSERRGAEFAVDWEAVVDFSGLGSEDAEPRMRVRTAARMPFKGIMIARDLVAPEESERRAREVLAEFVDLEAFESLGVAENEFGVRAWCLKP